jgi:hypothetical protein
MAEYRLIVLLARGRKWLDLAEVAKLSRIVPNRPTPPVGPNYIDSRPDPTWGILDPLFDPERLAAATGSVGEFWAWLVAARAAWPHQPEAITPRSQARAKEIDRGVPVGPMFVDTFADRWSYGQLDESSRAFVDGERCPRWIAGVLWGRHNAPDPVW